MATFHISYTSPVNPPNATPILTRPQIWTGLQRKIRFADEFVPAAITGTKVLSEEDGVVTRIVTFKDGMGPRGQAEAREIVRSYEWSWVDFEQEDGTHIRNVVSNGPGLDDESLQMTYMFEVRRPDLESGSEAAKKEFEKLTNGSKVAVESSIQKIREMVVDGRIGVDGKANF